MRTLSFENLRRLVGRRKDRDEPSFERSESFKRISIRKSYLDRGKRRTRLQKAQDAAETNVTTAPAPVVTIEVSSRGRSKNVIGPTIVQVRSGGTTPDDFDFDEKKEKRISRDDININNDELDDDDEDEKKVRRETPAGTIVYGQWINDIDSSYSSKDKKYGLDSYSSRDSKLNLDSSREKIYIPHDNRPFTKRNFALSPTRKINNNEERKVSSVLIELDKSPQLPRSQSRIQERDETDSIEETVDYKIKIPTSDHNGVTTVSVGSHHRRDPTLVAAASSYPLSSSNQSIECNVDDRSNNRNAVSRTTSVPDKPSVPKTDTSSTSASRFSLSLSFSRLTTDLRAAAVTTKNGLFRRKRTAPMKPAPSVSTEGYFERTAAASSSTRRSRRSNVGSGRRRPIYGSRRRKIITSKPSPAPASPVWFVPPERRRSNRQRGRVWREVRYLPQDESKCEGDNVDNRSNNWSNDSNLSDEFDDKKLLLSGDFEEKSEASLNPRKVDSGSTLDSSSLVSSAASSASLKPKISDFNEEKIFYEEYRGVKSKPLRDTDCNYFASSQFLGFVAKSSPSRSTSAMAIHNSHCGCTSSSESEPEEQQRQRRVLLVVGSGASSKDAKDAVNLNVAGAVKTANERRNCSVVLVLEGQKPPRAQHDLGPGQRRRPLRRKSQLKRSAGVGGANSARGLPVYLTRRRSSLRRRPCSKSCCFFVASPRYGGAVMAVSLGRSSVN